MSDEQLIEKLNTLYAKTDYSIHFPQFCYQQGRADEREKYTCHDDCINEDCTMCIRWNKLADCYEKEQKNDSSTVD